MREQAIRARTGEEKINVDVRTIERRVDPRTVTQVFAELRKQLPHICSDYVTTPARSDQISSNSMPFSQHNVQNRQTRYYEVISGRFLNSIERPTPASGAVVVSR